VDTTMEPPHRGRTRTARGGISPAAPRSSGPLVAFQWAAARDRPAAVRLGGGGPGAVWPPTSSPGGNRPEG
jgi:hypothetical protein